MKDEYDVYITQKTAYEKEGASLYIKATKEQLAVLKCLDKQDWIELIEGVKPPKAIDLTIERLEV